MINMIDCIKITSGDSDNGVWLISVGDKLFGEVKDKLLNQIKKDIQEFDLALNWLILDIVDSNRQTIIDNLKAKQSEPIDDLGEDELQVELENYVRSLISSGKFGNKIFKDYRDTIKDLLIKSDRVERVIATVKVCLKYRYIEQPTKIINPCTGYISANDIASHKINIGMSEAEIEKFMEQIWFTDGVLEKIYEFITVEHSGIKFSPDQPIEQDKDEKKVATT